MNASFQVKALVFFFIRVVSTFISYIVKKHLFQNLTLTHKPKSLTFALTRASARNISLSIPLATVRWPIHFINSDDNTFFPISLPHRSYTTVSFIEKLNLFILTPPANWKPKHCHQRRFVKKETPRGETAARPKLGRLRLRLRMTKYEKFPTLDRPSNFYGAAIDPSTVFSTFDWLGPTQAKIRQHG